MQVQAGESPGPAWAWWEGKLWLSCKNMPQFAQTRRLRAPEWVGDVPQLLEIHLSPDGQALPCLHTMVSWSAGEPGWGIIWGAVRALAWKALIRNHTAFPPTGRGITSGRTLEWGFVCVLPCVCVSESWVPADLDPRYRGWGTHWAMPAPCETNNPP